MLQSFKDRIRGSRWLGYTIVGIISVPFALWGIQAYMGGGAQTAAATVNGEEIPTRVVERQVAQQRRALSERFGGELPDIFSDQMLRERVVDQLITRVLLEQTAQDANLQITAEALAERIRGQSMFQRDGRFDRDLYQNLLRQSGLTPTQYETRVRDGARVEQLRQAVLGSAFVLDSQARRSARIEGQERRVASLQYAREDALQQVTADDKAIRDYYEANQERFRTPEQVKLAYVRLDIEALKAQVEVSDDAVRRAYEEEGQRYREAAEREASHILIEVPDGADEAAEQQALEEARALRERIREGADFAELARENSDDSGSAGQGGDLGAITRGMMVEPFEEALFSLESEGAVSDPVRTTYGYHLIKLTNVRERDQKPFSEVREQVADDLRTRRAQERFYERVEVLKNTAYENPGSLDAAAEATGIDVGRTDWLSRQSGEGIAGIPAVRRAAFTPEVLEDRRNSDVIELGDRSVVVVRVVDHREPRPLPLEDVRDQVRSAVVEQRADELLDAWADSITKELEQGVAPRTLAENGPARWIEHEWVQRSGSARDLPRGIVSQAFQLPPPAEGKPSFAETTLGDGSRAVVLVRELRYPEIEESALRQARQRRSRTMAQAEFRTWLEMLRADADIERFGGDQGSGTGATGQGQ